MIATDHTHNQVSPFEHCKLIVAPLLRSPDSTSLRACNIMEMEPLKNYGFLTNHRESMIRINPLLISLTCTDDRIQNAFLLWNVDIHSCFAESSYLVW